MKKTIGFVCQADPFKDRKAWSGTEYKLREAIELAGFNVIWIPYRTNTLAVLFARIRRKVEECSSKGKVMGTVMYQPLAKAYAQSIDISLVEQCDYLFFPGGTQIALFLKAKKPYISLADSTIPVMVDYYWFGLSRRFIDSAISLDRRACEGAMLNIRSSRWAFDSLIHDYHCSQENCCLLEFGPNIDTRDIAPVEPYREGILNILFSGVNWERKGGAIAVETVRLLREQGLDAHLFVAGPKVCPEGITECEFVTFVGFLDKNNLNDYKRYIGLYRQCHLLLLPTKAECSAIVYCEAAAFGLPCYTYSTGGTTDYVINEYNGRALPLSDGPAGYANAIYDDTMLGKLPVFNSHARQLHKEKLSWEAWARRFSEIINHLN